MDRRTHFFVKSNIKNIKGNIGMYIYFIFTVIILISISYSINSIFDSEYIISEIPYIDMRNILLITKVVSALFFLISVTVIFYIDDYIFSRQKDKYYLLRTMGLSGRNITNRIIIGEILLFIISFPIGIFIGAILNYGVTNSLIDIVNFHWDNSLRIYTNSILWTLCETCLFIFLLYIKNLKKFKNKSLDSLLIVDKKIDLKKKMKNKLNILFIGLIVCINILLQAYYKHIKNFKDISDNLKNLILVILFFLFFILLFLIMNLIMNSLQIKRMKRENNLKDLLVLVDITSHKRKIKSLLYISTIILFLCGVIPVISNILLGWADSFNEYKGNIDIQISSVYNSILDSKNIPEISDEDVLNYLSNKKLDVNKIIQIKRYLPLESQFYDRKRGQFPPYVMGLSEYNDARIMSGLKAKKLKDNEFLIHQLNIEKKEFTKQEIKLSNGKIVNNSNIVLKDSVGGEVLFNNDNPYIIVVNDKDTVGLLCTSKSIFIDTRDKIEYKLAERIEKELVEYLNDINKSLYNINNTGDPFYTLFEAKTATVSQNQFFMFQFAVKLLSLYFYIIALITALNILSFQYLNLEEIQKKNKSVLESIGVNKKEISIIRKKEKKLIYHIPLLLATLFTVIFVIEYLLINSKEIKTYISDFSVMRSILVYAGFIWLLGGIYIFIVDKISRRD